MSFCAQSCFPGNSKLEQQMEWKLIKPQHCQLLSHINFRLYLLEITASHSFSFSPVCDRILKIYLNMTSLPLYHQCILMLYTPTCLFQNPLNNETAELQTKISLDEEKKWKHRWSFKSLHWESCFDGTVSVNYPRCFYSWLKYIMLIFDWLQAIKVRSRGAYWLAGCKEETNH